MNTRSTASVTLPRRIRSHARLISWFAFFILLIGGLPAPHILATSKSLAVTTLRTPPSNFVPSSKAVIVTDSSTVQPVRIYLPLVQRSNDPPACRNISRTMLEDTIVDIRPDCADPDGEPMTYQIVVQGAKGTATTLNGQLRYVPAANANGTDSFTYRAKDRLIDSTPARVTIGITAVNDVPTFTKGADQQVLEDAGAQIVSGWARDIAPGPPNEASQTLTFLVTNNNNALFAAQPTVDAAGTLRYTPAPNAYGTTIVTVRLQDNGGTANGGQDTSAPQTFQITIAPINDAPRFTKGDPQEVLEDAGAQVVSGWARDIAPGPFNEAGQALTFVVTNNNNALFAAQPTVDAAGTLRYTPAPNAYGTATVTMRLQDNGGTANGGQDTSAPQTFQISVTPVNDAPTAILTAAPISGTVPLTVTFTANTHDPDGDPLTYTWMFGDGGTTNGAATTAHTYSLPGVFTATLTVSDGELNGVVRVSQRITTTVTYQTYGLNFSPYMDGQDPNRRTPIPEEQIRTRMRVIAPYTHWVRTFGCGDGLEISGRVAHEMGLKVAMGAWLGKDLAANEQQISCLIDRANAGQVDMAIVGSEVLLRNDLSADQLIAYIQRVIQAVPAEIPVTTADIHSFLLDNPSVISAVDIVFVNYYPYWAGIDVNHGIATIHGWHQEVTHKAQGKPVIVSETGWPSCGNQIKDAVPSPENASFYFKNFVSWARAENVPFFYFEAFDESWKVKDEGPQGACWGVWDKNGGLKPGMQDVFDGKTVPDNWSGDSIPGGPGDPVIEFTYVPPCGSSDNLRGQVWHVKPVDHKVVVYIRVDGRWWVKPFSNAPLTLIYPDGTWSTNITTGGVDALATDITAYLIPNDFDPPRLLGVSTLPAELDPFPHVTASRGTGSRCNLTAGASDPRPGL